MIERAVFREEYSSSGSCVSANSRRLGKKGLSQSSSCFLSRAVLCSSRVSGTSSHFKGMFWLVPSGSDRRMLMGRTPSRSSTSAISIGDMVPSGSSRSTGAPIETCKALAPTTRAFSNRVSLGGPIVICSGSLKLACALSVTLVLWPGRSLAFLGLRRGYYIVDLQNHPCGFCRGFYDLSLHAQRF